MLFRFEDVHKAYGAAEVLRGVSFQMNPGEKIGLVGRNGVGKTTLFRLLMGELKKDAEGEHPDKGRIICASNLRVGLLEQHHRFVSGTTVLETALGVFEDLKKIEERMKRLEADMALLDKDALDTALHEYSDLQHRYELEGGFSFHAKVESVLLGLGFGKEDFHLPVSHLSGGQQSRLSLAMLLLAEPDALLLDEPTNHLDIRAVEWLEEFLNAYKSAYVIISHDRFLLDRCTNRILELEAGAVNSYQGNFSFYLEEREERRSAQLRAYEQQQALIERTEEFIRRNLAGQKTKQAKSRRRMLENLERIEAVRSDSTASSFEVAPIARAGDVVLKVADLGIGYEGKNLASGLSFALRRGDVLAIAGGNGTGKTTLLRTLLGQQKPLEGEIYWGANVVIGYYDQHLRDLSPDDCVIDELRALEPNAEEVKLRSFLGRFNFRGDDVFKKIGELSGGEKGRLALARLVYTRVNVLVLDEPTNHLDIPSREALESALDEFTGTILVVSHDRYLLDRLATEIVYLDGVTAEVFSGAYSEYCDLLAERRLEAEKRARAENAVKRAKTRASSPKPKSPQTRSSEAVEFEIGENERALSAVSEAMASVETARSPERLQQLQKEYNEIGSRLDALYKEWEAAMERNESVS